MAVMTCLSWALVGQAVGGGKRWGDDMEEVVNVAFNGRPMRERCILQVVYSNAGITRIPGPVEFGRLYVLSAYSFATRAPESVWWSLTTTALKPYATAQSTTMFSI